MQNTTSLLSSDLLKLPVVLTPRAWQEAVHIEHPHDAAVISSRLGDVVLEAYRELHMQPDCTQIHFGLWAFHAIRPLSPPTSGHLFHGHPAGQSERSDAGLHC